VDELEMGTLMVPADSGEPSGHLAVLRLTFPQASVSLKLLDKALQLRDGRVCLTGVVLPEL
jgi:hypothetical protein